MAMGLQKRERYKLGIKEGLPGEVAFELELGGWQGIFLIIRLSHGDGHLQSKTYL